jgi:hypothetical protein
MAGKKLGYRGRFLRIESSKGLVDEPVLDRNLDDGELHPGGQKNLLLANIHWLWPKAALEKLVVAELYIDYVRPGAGGD